MRGIKNLALIIFLGIFIFSLGTISSGGGGGEEDDTPPTITINSPESKIYNLTNILVNISASDDNNIDTIWYNWNGSNITYTEPITIKFDENENKLTAWANDSAGNNNSIDVTFTIDTIPPIISNASLNQTILYYESEEIKLLNEITDDNLDKCWYEYDDNNVTFTCNETVTITTSLNALNIIVYANDSAGNLNNKSLQLTIDDTLPEITINSNPTVMDLSINHTINFTAKDVNLKHCILEYNEVNTTIPCTSEEEKSINFTIDKEILTGKIWAIDLVENEAYEEFTLIIDDTPPEIIINSPEPKTYDSKNILVNIVANDDNIDTIWYNWNGKNITYTEPITIEFNEGANKLTAWANDSAGNNNSVDVTFKIEIPRKKSKSTPAPVQYSLNKTSLNDGEEIQMNLNEKIKLEVDSTNHTITLTQFNLTHANIIIQSEIIYATLEKGIISEFDLNDDLINDIEVIYKGVNSTSNKAIIFIQKKGEPETNFVEEEDLEDLMKNQSSTFKWIIFGVITLMVAIIVIYIFKKDSIIKKKKA